MSETTLTKSNGFAVFAPKLEACAETIKRELSEVNRLFLELVPRCTTIGHELNRAKGFFGNDTQGFYAWAESNFGIKQRQVRTYLAFAGKIERIEAEADAQNVALTSMEQGLALLAPAKEVKDSDTDDARLEALSGAIARAKGATTKAHAAILEVVGVSGLDPRTRAAFEAMEWVLNSWSTPEVTDDGTITSPVAVETLPLAVNRQDDWKDEPAESPTKDEPTAEAPADDAPQEEKDKALLKSKGLPADQKPGKWTYAQLEEGLALCDDNQTRLAAAIGVSKAAVSSNLKSKRPKVEAESPTEQAPEPVAAA